MKNILLLPLLSFAFSISNAQNFPVGNRNTTFVDASRNNRNIAVEIYYPAASAGANTPVASGVFPLMVIGHGFSMGVNAYYNFRDFFVPKGYIVVLTDTETGLGVDHPTFAADLNFCVNQMQDENTNAASIFFEKVKNKTALMGHSMGGGASFLAAGTGNANITTLIGFAPAETSTSAIQAATSITIPALMLYGNKDNVTPPANHVIPMYNNLASSCKHLVSITDGSHCGFALGNFACDFGESTVCPFCSFINRTTHHNKTFEIMLPWLEFFLQGNCNEWTTFETKLSTVSGISSQSSCNYSLPQATITPLGPAFFCPGGSVTLSGSPDYEFYNWSNGATTSDIAADVNGDYTLIVTDTYDCQDTSAPFTVTVFDVEAPEIYLQNDTLFTDATTVIDWYLDGVSLNSTDNFITSLIPGTYTVEIIDENDCSAISDDYNFLVSEAKDLMDLRFSIYPNPVSNMITVVFHSKEKVLLYITDINGKILYSEKNISENSWHMNLSEFRSGIYLVTLETEVGTLRKKIAKY